MRNVMETGRTCVECACVTSRTLGIIVTVTRAPGPSPTRSLSVSSKYPIKRLNVSRKYLIKREDEYSKNLMKRVYESSEYPTRRVTVSCKYLMKSHCILQ